jgi:hypothetical protein
MHCILNAVVPAAPEELIVPPQPRHPLRHVALERRPVGVGRGVDVNRKSPRMVRGGGAIANGAAPETPSLSRLDVIAPSLTLVNQECDQFCYFLTDREPKTVLTCQDYELACLTTRPSASPPARARTRTRNHWSGG